MVRTQRPSIYENKLLVGSDLADPGAARRELEQWVRDKGYHLPAEPRQFSVFDQGMLVREWVLVDMLPESKRARPRRLFPWLRARSAARPSAERAA